MRRVCLVGAALLAVAGCTKPCDSGPEIPGIPTAGPLCGLTLYGGWQNPRALPAPVNTRGWEDSPFISADGQTLYFGYTRRNVTWWENCPATFDLLKDCDKKDGAIRPGEEGDYWNVYEATVRDGAWQVVDSSVNQDPTISQGAQAVDDGKSSMVLARLGQVDNGQYEIVGDLYASTSQDGAWTLPTRLDAPISTPCVEDDPTLSPDGSRLYFDTNRIDPAGANCQMKPNGGHRDLYASTLVNGTWSAPEPVRGDPNQGDTQSQPWVDDAGDFWWTGHDARCHADNCLYHAYLQPDGSYASSSVMAEPTAAPEPGEVLAIGEASMTRDGHFLYFVYAVETESSITIDGKSVPVLDFDIGVATRP